MIKYKPWNNEISNVWDNEDVCNKMFFKKCNSFFQIELGQQLVPDWRRHLSNADIYLFNDTVNHDFEDVIDASDFPREDWMYLAELSSNQVAEGSSAIDEQYWSQCHHKFSENEINGMSSWFIMLKKC